MNDSTSRACGNAYGALRAAGAGRATWRDAAQAIGQAVGADATGILVWRTGGDELESEEGVGFDLTLMREYGEYYYRYDVLLQRHPPVGEWQVSNERFPDAQWSHHPFFGDLLHRHRIRQIAALTLRAGDDYKVGLILQRHTRTGLVASDFDLGPLKRLTTEAARAFESRYGIAMAVRQSLQDALGDSAAYAFVADSGGRAQPLCGGEELIVPAPFAFRHGRIFHADDGIQRQLLGVLARAASGTRSRLRVPGYGGSALYIDARPLPRHAALANQHQLALVRIEVRSPQEPDESTLRTQFGLTAAQARVLQLLCEGASVAQCADRLRCSVATVRTHVSALLLRMGRRRQAELVRAAMRLQ